MQQFYFLYYFKENYIQISLRQLYTGRHAIDLPCPTCVILKNCYFYFHTTVVSGQEQAGLLACYTVYPASVRRGCGATQNKGTYCMCPYPSNALATPVGLLRSAPAKSRAQSHVGQWKASLLGKGFRIWPSCRRPISPSSWAHSTHQPIFPLPSPHPDPPLSFGHLKPPLWAPR